MTWTSNESGFETADDPVYQRRCRRGFYEHALGAQQAGMSAGEWEEFARESDHAWVVGERCIEAISSMVWQWDR